jgi:hypothetical protein
MQARPLARSLLLLLFSSHTEREGELRERYIWVHRKLGRIYNPPLGRRQAGFISMIGSFFPDEKEKKKLEIDHPS